MPTTKLKRIRNAAEHIVLDVIYINAVCIGLWQTLTGATVMITGTPGLTSVLFTVIMGLWTLLGIAAMVLHYLRFVLPEGRTLSFVVPGFVVAVLGSVLVGFNLAPWDFTPTMAGVQVGMGVWFITFLMGHSHDIKLAKDEIEAAKKSVAEITCPISDEQFNHELAKHKNN